MRFLQPCSGKRPAWRDPHPPCKAVLHVSAVDRSHAVPPGRQTALTHSVLQASGPRVVSAACGSCGVQQWSTCAKQSPKTCTHCMWPRLAPGPPPSLRCSCTTSAPPAPPTPRPRLAQATPCAARHDTVALQCASLEARHPVLTWHSRRRTQTICMHEHPRALADHCGFVPVGRPLDCAKRIGSEMLPIPG